MQGTSSPKRRVKLEGRDSAGLYRSSSGRIEIAYRVGGKLCWHSMPQGSSIAEARAKRAELTIKKSQGTLAAPSKLTVAKAVSIWLEEGKASWAPSTYSSREATMRLHVVPAIGTVRLRELTDDHLWRVVLEMRAKKEVGASTIRLVLSQIAAMLGHAADAKHLSIVPTLSKRRRSELRRKGGNTNTRKKVVNDVPALLAASEDDWRLLLKTAALSGLRLAEVLGLRVRDVEEGTIHVRGQLDRGSRAWVGRTKTPSSQRSVSVPSGLTKELLASVGPDADRDALVFSRDGRGHWAQVAERAFIRAAKKAGLDETLRFHSLRHTAASRWIHEGRSVAFVQGQLGHASPSETLNTYTHEWNEVAEGIAAREAADVAYEEATPKPKLKLVGA